MLDSDAAIRQVRAALEFDNAINLHRHPVKVTIADDAVVLEGEVESVAAKKLALEHAGAVPGVRGVVDRLRVAAAEHRGDGAIRDVYCALLSGQREFLNCGIRMRDNDGWRVLRAAPEPPFDRSGDIQVTVQDGVITLDGAVISLSHKRVAGVLGWWTPGCRDVVNSLEIDPPERDGDEEVVEALALVFEMDQELDADQIRARCDDYVVTLEGYARTEEQRRRAELDAWAIFGVNKVVNHLAVAA